MIHDVITTANPFPYTAKFMCVGVRNREYVHGVVVYQKYLGELIIFELDIFEIRQHYIRIWCCRLSKISNEVGRIDNFRALARKLSFRPTECNPLGETKKTNLFHPDSPRKNLKQLLDS